MGYIYEIRPVPIDPVALLKPISREREVMEAVLDAAGIYGEARSIAIYEANIKLGIWKKPPCEEK